MPNAWSTNNKREDPARSSEHVSRQMVDGALGRSAEGVGTKINRDDRQICPQNFHNIKPGQNSRLTIKFFVDLLARSLVRSTSRMAVTVGWNLTALIWSDIDNGSDPKFGCHCLKNRADFVRFEATALASNSTNTCRGPRKSHFFQYRTIALIPVTLLFKCFTNPL